MKAKVLFDQSLERCLQELARTGDVEASVQHYPQHADQLRPLLELALVTRRTFQAVPEAPGGLVAGRERMLAAVAQQRDKGIPVVGPLPVSRRWTRFTFATKLLTVLLVGAFCITAIGSGVVLAAQDSLPGDLLYPVKLTTEDVRMSLASVPGGQVDLAMQFTKERTDEIKTLVAAGRQVPDKTVARMEQHIEHALSLAASATDEEMANLLTQISVRTRAQQQMLEQVHADAPHQAQARLERAVRMCRQGVEAAADGLSDPETFRHNYRHQERIAQPTDEPQSLTATPRNGQEPGQEQNQHQEQEQWREDTPVGTPHMTPQGPQATPGPHMTPQGPQATPGPHMTPQGPQATPGPHMTPQGPQATPGPHMTPQGPQATPGPHMTPNGP